MHSPIASKTNGVFPAAALLGTPASSSVIHCTSGLLFLKCSFLKKGFLKKKLKTLNYSTHTWKFLRALGLCWFKVFEMFKRIVAVSVFAVTLKFCSVVGIFLPFSYNVIYILGKEQS